MLDIYVDADGCPVKDEVYKVARRYDLLTYVVSNRHIRVPFEEKIRAVVVGDAFDAADDWIAERVGEDDIVITADLPLADRCIKAGAAVLGPKGQVHDENSIGSALASRELMDQLRQMGMQTGGPAPMDQRGRSTFLARLDETIQRIRNAAG
ncbi:MAG: YaiI/YqxD family protein [Deferrisomatales bacterium]|nr:YaiI/YqxD family protein [Deferrisomatales bacterium]HSH69279.1 YaiI/YqxD family protein [Deferrisomatales bacterium]